MHYRCLDQLNFQIRSHGSPLPRRKSRLCTCSALPPTTCSQAVSEARAALRRYREASREKDSKVESDAATVIATDNSQLLATTKNRLTVQLPLPSPNYKNDDLVRSFDEGEWPGGIQQRFRALRPSVEKFIDSFGSPSFVGMLESPADGIGVWTAFNGTATIVTFVNNATFAPFVRLCQGDFGDKVLNSEHILIAINPNWTQSKDIGQLWDRELKKKAAELIDDVNAWLPLYHLEDIRTAAGSLGLLWKSHPGPWRLYSAVLGSDLLVENGEEDRGNVARRIGDILTGKNNDNDDEKSALVAVELLLESEIRPERSEIIRLLNAANTQRKQGEESKKKSSGKKLGQGWWGGL